MGLDPINNTINNNATEIKSTTLVPSDGMKQSLSAFEELPTDILCEIFKNMTLSELSTGSLVSKKVKSICRTKEVENSALNRSLSFLIDDFLTISIHPKVNVEILKAFRTFLANADQSTLSKLPENEQILETKKKFEIIVKQKTEISDQELTVQEVSLIILPCTMRAEFQTLKKLISLWKEEIVCIKAAKLEDKVDLEFKNLILDEKQPLKSSLLTSISSISVDKLKLWVYHPIAAQFKSGYLDIVLHHFAKNNPIEALDLVRFVSQNGWNHCFMIIHPNIANQSLANVNPGVLAAYNAWVQNQNIQRDALADSKRRRLNPNNNNFS